MSPAHRSDGADDAPVLVLSGSLGTTTAMWDPQVAAFARHYRVLRFDHPGHGDSPVPTAPVTVEGIARDLLALLDELDIDRVDFCGLSLGGMVGQWLGANAPDRISGLVLAYTGASLGEPGAYAARAELVRREGTGILIDGARERWFTPAFRDALAAQRILDSLRTMSPQGYAACCEAVGAFDFRGDLQRIQPPTLVLYGEDDPVTTPEILDKLATIRRARRRGIAHAAHLANVEQPEAFSVAVLSHLQEGAKA
ncbi:MAG TPA: 3-oxoadipate enol-lactonase [Gaiellaceae bacterium]